jgi:hypothetical protein
MSSVKEAAQAVMQGSDLSSSGGESDHGSCENHAAAPQVPPQVRASDAAARRTGNLPGAESPQVVAEIESTPTTPQVEDGIVLVGWYADDDPDKPENWSHFRRGLITFFLYLYTSVIYMSSAIYTPSEDGVMEEFGVNHTESALGLALFVLG